MCARLSLFSCLSALIFLAFSPLTSGAEFPSGNLELAFFPTQEGEPVPGGVAYTRNYTLSGPVDGGVLLPGMLLQPGAGSLYAAQLPAVYRYDPDTQVLQAMDLSGVIPAVSWPMGITYDTRLRRMVLVTLGGEGNLYNYVVPDPTNAPGTGVFSFLGSMDNKDVDSIAYVGSLNTFYALGFSYGPGMPARIFRIAADGSHLGFIPLPELPYDISLTGYQGELVAWGDYLVLFLEPRPGTNPLVKESRIYLINPTTYEVHLTYQRDMSATPPDTTGPDVAILAPTNNTKINLDTPVQLQARATDTGGVQRVEIYQNGSFLSLASLNAGSSNLYSLSWSNAPVGTNRIVARAVDTAGNIGSSDAINLVVLTNTTPGNTNQPGTNQPDTTPPTVQMQAPSNGARVELGRPIQLTARAVDGGGNVQLLEFLRNGVLIARGGNSRAHQDTFHFSWSNAPLGTNIIAARATDAAGNMATSAPVNVVVYTNAIPVPANQPPLVRITFPEPNTSIALGVIRLMSSASDPDGSIAKVEFYVDGALLGARTPTNGTTDMFLFEWTPAKKGSYEVYARATDNGGLSTRSATVWFQVGMTPPAENISARRSLPDSFRPGYSFEVKIEVDTGRSVDSWRLEDVPPAGWRVTGISHGGSFDKDTGKVKFGPFDRGDRTLRYYVSTSTTNVGMFTFTGGVIADRTRLGIIGDSQTTASPRKLKIWKNKFGKWVFWFDWGDDEDDDDGRWVVEYRDSFARDGWTQLPGAKITVSEAGEFSIDDPTAPDGQRFYRVRFLDDD